MVDLFRDKNDDVCIIIYKKIHVFRTKIFIGQIMSQHPNFAIHIGELFQVSY